MDYRWIIDGLYNPYIVDSHHIPTWRGPCRALPPLRRRRAVPQPLAAEDGRRAGGNGTRRKNGAKTWRKPQRNVIFMDFHGSFGPISEGFFVL